MQKYYITQEQIKTFFDHLATKPWKEVNHLVVILLQLPTVPETPPAPPEEKK